MTSLARRRLWSFFEALYSQELTTESPRTETPQWIKPKLLPHQQAALSAALKLEQAKHDGMTVGNIAGDSIGGTLYTTHGILADPVGSGKSLTALALMKSPPPSHQYTEYVTRSTGLQDGRDVGLLRNRNQLTTSYGTQLRPVRPALLLIPHALMGQWEQYITRDSTMKARYIRRKQDAIDETFLQSIETYDVVVVSASMWPVFRAHQPVSSLLWSRVFIDEADSIALSNSMEELHGLFYWFISASWMNLVFANSAYFNIDVSYRPLPETPPEIVTRVQQLQSGGSNILCIPGCRHVNIVRRMCGIGSGGFISINSAGSQSARLIVHSNADFLASSFSRPVVTHTNILCETPANIFVLDSFISPDMMERLHAGDIQGALDSVGMQTSSESDVIKAVTASLEKDLENAKRTYEYKKSMDYSSEQIKQKAVEACEHKIAGLESRISAIKERIKTSADQTCPICYSNVTAAPAVTPCCHQLFCFQCLCESLKRVAACPMCRARIDDLKEIKIVGEAEAEAVAEDATVDIKPKKKHKKAAFLEFVKANPKSKILMFSGYDGTFSGLDEQLRAESISFALLSGSQARITKLLNEFEAGKYNVLFLNARNMGAGLNIDSASHVVLFHRMIPELESQIIGRALRLGRRTSLDVVHLLHDNELSSPRNLLIHE
jgi:SNF2 family DNA or RNA helicase